MLPQWEPLSNLDEWLTLGGIIITSEEEPEGDLCSDLGNSPLASGIALEMLDDDGAL